MRTAIAGSADPHKRSSDRDQGSADWIGQRHAGTNRLHHDEGATLLVAGTVSQSPIVIDYD
jgi:hypothetical protein